jgi:D-alanyl-D-alanine carboxypeptidase
LRKSLAYTPVIHRIILRIILFIACCESTFVNAQEFDPIIAAQLQQKTDSMRQAKNYKGVSAAILLPGEVLWTGVSGVSYSDVLITPDMRFQIGSITKTFTATLLLKLRENNLVNLEDPIDEWLPSYNPNIESTVTIRQLLNHTSGIANTFDVEGYMDSLSFDWNRVFTMPEILSWLPPAIFPPGAGQRYSNPNYHLTGLVIESATGQQLETLLRDSLFNPMDLNATYFPIEETLQGPIAHPWKAGADWNDTARVSLLTAQWSAGAIYSTASNMARFLDHLFNQSFLDDAELADMTTFIGPQNRGLGIQEIEMADRTVWGHPGGSIGYNSIMVFDPALSASVVVLINDDPSSALDIAEELLRTLVDASVEVPEMNDEKIVLYPNPSNNWVKFELNASMLEFINIYDMQGSFIRQVTTPSFSINDLAPGSYVLKVKTKEHTFEKILVKL